MRAKKAGQRGWTLAETALVMALATTVGAVSLKAAAGGMAAADATILSADMRTLAKAVEDSRAHLPDFSGLTADSFKANAPERLVVDGRLSVGLGMGEVALAAEAPNVPGVSSPSYRISVAGMPGRVCSAAAASLASAFDKLEIGGVDVGAGDAYRPDEAARACGSAPRAGTTVAVVSKRRGAWVACMSLGERLTEGACPAPKTGKIVYSETYSCPSGYEPGAWSAPVKKEDLCS